MTPIQEPLINLRLPLNHIFSMIKQGESTTEDTKYSEVTKTICVKKEAIILLPFKIYKLNRFIMAVHLDRPLRQTANSGIQNK